MHVRNVAAAIDLLLRCRLKSLSVALLGLLTVVPAWAHANGQPPAPSDLWTAWTLDPLVTVPLGVSAILYAVGMIQAWQRAGFGRGVSFWEAAAFWGGILALAFALVWPLDAMGESLFAAHMAQHIVLMGLAAPLLVFGAPLPTMIRSLPRRLQRICALLVRLPAWRTAWSWLASLFVATVLQQIAVWLWHSPPAVAVSLSSDAVHAIMHASLFTAALLFWSALARRLSSPLWTVAPLLITGKLYLFLGALLAFSSSALYPAYGAGPKLWGFSLVEDQQLAGVLMMGPGATMYLMLAVVFVALWLTNLDQPRGSPCRAATRQRDH